MEVLQSLGIRVDDQAKLKIISSETEVNSVQLSAEAKLLLVQLEQLKGKLDRLTESLEVLNDQTRKSRKLSIANRISKISSGSA